MLFLPRRRTGYSLCREARPSPYGNAAGMWALLLPWGGHSTRGARGLALLGTQQVCVGSAHVEDLLCAK